MNETPWYLKSVLTDIRYFVDLVKIDYLPRASKQDAHKLANFVDLTVTPLSERQLVLQLLSLFFNTN